MTDYYNQYARDYFNRTITIDMSAVHVRFLAYVPEGGAILDAGCGVGRDTKAFLDQGYVVDAFDASAEMVRMAREYTGRPVEQMTFQDVPGGASYDGIWACASLLHVARAALGETIAALSKALKPGGVMYMSFKYGEDEGTRGDRHFTDMTEDTLLAILAPIPDLRLVETWTTNGPPSLQSQVWLNAIVR